MKAFFGLDREVMEENNLPNQPEKIFNVIESRFYFSEKGNNEVVDMKGSETAH
jgi:hypothetical protein